MYDSPYEVPEMDSKKGGQIMKDALEIIRALNDWPFVVLVISVVFIIVMRERIAEWDFSFKTKNNEFKNKVKTKDIRKLSTSKVQIKAIKPVEPPDYEEAAAPVILLKDARKVLATLWDGQNRRYPEKGISEGQWSFRILPHSPEYGNFMVGFAQLLGMGLAGWEGKNGQAVLTQKGWEYAKDHPEIRDSQDVYRF